VREIKGEMGGTKDNHENLQLNTDKVTEGGGRGGGGQIGAMVSQKRSNS
jgi:hypothetical protein